MQARPRNVEVYVEPSGAVPFDDWMAKLKDIIGRAAIDTRIGLLRRGSLGKKYEDIGDGLIELKVDTGPGYRIYLADDGSNSLLLCALRGRTLRTLKNIGQITKRKGDKSHAIVKAIQDRTR